MYQYEKFVEDVLREPERFPKTIIDMVKRYNSDLERDDVYMDHVEAERHLKFTKLIPLVDLKEFANKPIVLQDWQAFLIANIYGWKYRKNGYRKYKKVYLQIARKNSKTTVSSVLSIDNAITDPENGGQIYFAATNKEQAELCFDMAKRMVGEMGRMYKSFKPICNVWRNSIEFINTQTVMKAVTGDPSSLEGMGAKCAIIDEVHVHKDDKLINSISKGQVLHHSPLLIMITTAGYDKTENAPAYQSYMYSKNILNGTMEDDNFFCMIWEMDEDDDWNDKSKWGKANPNLGLSPKMESLESEYQMAKNLGGAKEVDFKIKHLNMWVDSDNVWISNDIVKAGQMDIELWPEDVRKLYNGERVNDVIKCRCGLDLASVHDFTSLCFEVVYEGKIYVWWKFYLPEKTMATTLNDNYRVWRAKNLITVTPGNATDYNFIKKDISTMYENGVLHNVYYDRFNSSQLVIDLSEMGIPMVKMGQGFMDMNTPSKDMEMQLLNSNVQHGNNPIFLWMMGNVKILYNENGDQKFSKKHSNGKIDGVVAWAMARKANIDEMNEYSEGPGVFII